MTFQEKLYQLRRERSLSQEGLASALGVSRQAVQKWESGAASPDTNNLIALSDFFGVTLDSLLKNDTAALAPALGDGAPEERVWRPYHYEYKSRRTLFGLPLVHIHFGGRRVCRAKGIIAIGDIATGCSPLAVLRRASFRSAAYQPGCSHWVGWQSACLPPAAWGSACLLPRGALR